MKPNKFWPSGGQLCDDRHVVVLHGRRGVAMFLHKVKPYRGLSKHRGPYKYFAVKSKQTHIEPRMEISKRLGWSSRFFAGRRWRTNWQRCASASTRNSLPPGKMLGGKWMQTSPYSFVESHLSYSIPSPYC